MFDIKPPTMAYSDTHNLSAYFQQSGQFYYILTDLKGEFVYVNPLFKKDFGHIAEKEKYQAAIQQCLKNFLTPLAVELKVKSQAGLLFSIHWEFSAYSNDGVNPSGVRGIGVATSKTKESAIAQPKDQIHNTQQRQFIQAAIDEHEKERQDIGKELHDNINQHLTTTRLYLEVVRDKVSGENLEIINLAHKGLSSIIKEIRQLSQSLVPPTLCDIGLIESVKDICDSLERIHSLSINFCHRHFNENQLPDNLKLMLYRIIQEQLDNILHHANADKIKISFQSDAEYIMLFICDNGKGFDSSVFTKGSGLTNITNRAGLFNGCVEINASPGKGCSLSVIIPYPVVEKLGMN
jgi:signal transduction histidine kinase